MTTTTARITTTQITAAIAAALISAGMLAGGAALAPTEAQNLADYGSSITAQNSEEDARAEGVRHMGDRSHAPGYFERMDGGDR